MLTQHEALDILEGSGVVSVKVIEDDEHLHSFMIITTEGECICVYGNYLRVECYEPSDVEKTE